MHFPWKIAGKKGGDRVHRCQPASMQGSIVSLFLSLMRHTTLGRVKGKTGSNLGLFYSLLLPVVETWIVVCCVILRGRHSTIRLLNKLQMVHWPLYIAAKCHLRSQDSTKDELWGTYSLDKYVFPRRICNTQHRPYCRKLWWTEAIFRTGFDCDGDRGHPELCIHMVG